MQHKLLATLLSLLSASHLSAAAPVSDVSAGEPFRGLDLTVQFCQGQMLAAPCVEVHVDEEAKCYEIPDSNRFGDRGSSFRIAKSHLNAVCQMHDGHGCTGWVGPVLAGVAKWDDSSTAGQKYNIYRSFKCGRIETAGPGVSPGGEADPYGGKAMA